MHEMHDQMMWGMWFWWAIALLLVIAIVVAILRAFRRRP